MISIERIYIDDNEWDNTINKFDTKTVFHESAWLNYLKSAYNGEIVRAAIKKDGEVIGFFCGLFIKKGGFRVFGSPLRGWWTGSMGLIMNLGEINNQKNIEALERFLNELKIHHFEMTNYFINPEIMTSAGFKGESYNPYILYLGNNDEATIFKNMRRECRNRLRKAIKSNLVVEETDDYNFIDEHYKHLLDVFVRKNLIPTHSTHHINALFKNLKPKNRLLTFRVKTSDGETIGTGMFPFDERCIYFTSGACLRKYFHLCPNEFLHWSVIKFALSRKIPIYHMAPGGRFKAKFGAKEFKNYRWKKSCLPAVEATRNAYRAYRRAKQIIMGLWHKIIKDS